MNDHRTEKNTERRILVALLIWGLSVTGLAAIDMFGSLPRPLIALLAVLGIAIPTAAYFLSPGLRAYFQKLGIRWLTAFHIWRIGAGLLFVFYGSLGLLPELFVRNAGYGDIIVGLLAYLALVLPMSAGRYLTVHLIGFADFILAVSTGLTLVLAGDPLMNNLTGLPVVLIPLFGVGVSGAAHLIAFDVLWRNRKQSRRPAEEPAVEVG